ncbi:MAG: PPC domain-containing protein [Spirochaetes bacterium]|nr:PPC domain-containing protein [Spirochaetota bacterium]
MRNHSIIVRIVILGILMAAGLAAQNRPHIGYVYPAGARQGEKITVRIGGQFLETVTNIHITGSGITGGIAGFSMDIDDFQRGQLYNQRNILEGRLNIVRIIITNFITNMLTNAVINVNDDGTTTTVITDIIPTKKRTTNYITNMITNVAVDVFPILATNITTNTVETTDSNGVVMVRTTYKTNTTAISLTNVVAMVGSNNVTNYTTNITALFATNIMSSNARSNVLNQLARTEKLISYLEPLPQEPDMMRYMSVIKRKKQPNAQLTDIVRVDITVSPDAPPGRREIRLATPRGVSEPLVFFVGQLPEFQEREPNDTTNAFYIGTLPAVVNGQILPGDVDRFRFSALKGQSLVFAVQSRDLMPYMADAVPGWCQSVLTLYDAKGKEVAFADDFYGNPDPVLPFIVPADGDYIAEIRDSIYRGREDFVYRITAGELPYVTGIFPLGGPRTGTTRVQMSGFNLPMAQTTIEPNMTESGIITIAPVAGVNPILFYADDLPEVFETENNNILTNAQRVTIPAVINGRIGRPGDVDIYRFTGKAGDRIIADVYARRLGSPLDSMLRLTDSKGAVLMTNDDYADKSYGLLAHQADSYISYVLPTNGTYHIIIRDTQDAGGDVYAYRLRLGPPRPDFKIRVTPSAINLPRGGTMPLTLYVQRIDGFDGDISLSMENAPEGLSLSGGVIRSKDDTVRVTVSATSNISGTEAIPVFYGTATIGGKTVRHTALAAEDMMQAFAYRHLVPSDDLIITFQPRRWLGLTVELPTNGTLMLTAGKDTKVPIRQLHGPYRSNRITGMLMYCEIDPPVKGIVIDKTNIAPATPTNTPFAVVLVDAAVVKPGTKGNLIINAYSASKGKDGVITYSRNLLNTLPAVPFEVVGP